MRRMAARPRRAGGGRRRLGPVFSLRPFRAAVKRGPASDAVDKRCKEEGGACQPAVAGRTFPAPADGSRPSGSAKDRRLRCAVRRGSNGERSMAARNCSMQAGPVATRALSRAFNSRALSSPVGHQRGETDVDQAAATRCSPVTTACFAHRDGSKECNREMSRIRGSARWRKRRDAV
ncbi:hypothetical protein MTO96_006621 [Rhipicephalus appendiculatus]